MDLQDLTNGTRCSRLCDDGSKHAAPHLHYGTNTFASSLEQLMWRLFVALCAALGLLICGGDVTDACMHAPGPTKPTFMSWDDAKAERWFTKTGEQIPKGEPFKDILKVAMPGNASSVLKSSGQLWFNSLRVELNR
jgi:hypothetical protein